MILVRNNLMWKLYVLSIYHTFKYPSRYSRNIEQILPYDMAQINWMYIYNVTNDKQWHMETLLSRLWHIYIIRNKKNILSNYIDSFLAYFCFLVDV